MAPTRALTTADRALPSAAAAGYRRASSGFALAQWKSGLTARSAESANSRFSGRQFTLLREDFHKGKELFNGHQRIGRSNPSPHLLRGPLRIGLHVRGMHIEG